MRTREDIIEDGLITAAELLAMKEDGDVRLLDATYMVPEGDMSPAQAYLAAHIPGAQFFDIDAVADPDSDMAHMLPGEAFFADAMGAFGLRETDFIVVYDRSPAFMAAARCWWMLRCFGHTNVCVLDGGLAAWQAAGGDIASGPETAPPCTDYPAHYVPALYAAYDDVARMAAEKDDSLIDARPGPRFQDGHIPGSRNVPTPELVTPDGHLKNAAELEKLFANFPAKDRLLTTTCGSGVTACTLALALYRTGRKAVRVYDGSWTEYSRKAA